MIPGDLIMSVIEQARRESPLPSQSQVTNKKQAAVGVSANDGQSFAKVLDAKSGRAERAVAAKLDAHVEIVRAGARKPSAEVMLQGLLLQSVLEVMLSQQGESLTGKGTAGRMWRSLLAEHVAKEVGPALDLRLFRDGKAAAVENIQAGPAAEPTDRRTDRQV